MTAKQVIAHVMKTDGWTQPALVEALKNFGQNMTVQSLNERLSTRRSSSLNAANMNAMLRALGYKVVVMPADMRTPDGGFEIDDGLTQKAGESK